LKEAETKIMYVRSFLRVSEIIKQIRIHIYVDFEPGFSVHPKSIKLGQITTLK